MKKTQLLNLLIAKYHYESYLEIGVQHRENNFNFIFCSDKVDIDPNPLSPYTIRSTSDDYFNRFIGDKKFDLIFIDGLHHAEQVIRDITNSVSVLNNNGSIVVHDCLPTTELMQVRDDHGGEWTGDVWKAIAMLRTLRDDLSFVTYDMDYGCCLIKKEKSMTYIPEEHDFLSWEYFEKHKHEMMNIISAPSLDCVGI